MGDFDDWFYTTEPKYCECTKKEMMDFLKKYPHSIESDFFMDRVSYYDFSFAPMWPFCLCVASAFVGGEPETYKVCTNVEEIRASQIPEHWAEFRDGTWVKTIRKP